MACQENSERGEAASSGQLPTIEAAWRSTNAADWKYVQTLTSGTRATLKVSKDNVIFGVRAVDAAGHRSLPLCRSPKDREIK